MLAIEQRAFFSLTIPWTFTMANDLYFREYYHFKTVLIADYRIKDFIMIIIPLKRFLRNWKQLYFYQFIIINSHSKIQRNQQRTGP